jgi:hypothetical protein
LALPHPEVVAHADWSVSAGKRWLARADRRPAGGYRLFAPEPVGQPGAVIQRLTAGGSLFLGLDLPFGVPAAWAERAGVEDFRALLPALGHGSWSAFFEPAAERSEIGTRRPFYPRHAGSRGTVRISDLVQELGLSGVRDLHRRCDLAHPDRPRAAPLFWTVGAKQVGRAAISAWRDLIQPTLAAGIDLAIWPFEGPLDQLLARHPVVLAETYPAEMQGQIGVRIGRVGFGSKRRKADRQAAAPDLLSTAAALGLELEPALRAATLAGFGDAADGEDRFDCVLGLLGMLNVVLGRRAPDVPADPEIRRIEGWILGQRAT